MSVTVLYIISLKRLFSREIRDCEEIRVTGRRLRLNCIVVNEFQLEQFAIACAG